MIRFLDRNCIPYHYLHTTKENKREKEILDLVKDTDFLVLARYMQVNLISFVLVKCQYQHVPDLVAIGFIIKRSS